MPGLKNKLLMGNEPFFAQINMPEAEYDIYDRESWKHPRVKWYGEEGTVHSAPIDAWVDEITRNGKSASLRTERWRYTRWGEQAESGNEELYDHQNEQPH